MKTSFLSLLLCGVISLFSHAQEIPSVPIVGSDVPVVEESAKPEVALNADAKEEEARLGAILREKAAVNVGSEEVVASVETESDWVKKFSSIVTIVDDWVWGRPLILLILIVGLVLTCTLRMVHVFNIKRAIRYMFKTEQTGHGEVSSFGALCTALSATIGTGNIVGVATAIGTGGPGALFWMEVAAFLGMATKYSEGLLAVKYREVKPDGTILGGPFYYIEKGLGRKWKWLAVMFAVFGILAGIMGIGTITQIHGITSAVQRFFAPNFDPASTAEGIRVFGAMYSTPTVIAGLIVTVCTALVLIGGLKSISRVSSIVVPFMAVFYILICIFMLVGNLSHLSASIELIFKSAFNPQAFTGGAVGSIIVAMQKGIARGIFSNEAGLGSAPIAAAAAKTNEPARQGLVCMTGTFIDTIIVCTMTGLAIVTTGAWEPELGLKGVDITIEAFSRGLAFVPNADFIAPLFLMVSLSFFAFTTILGWNYYSEKCLEYLIGPGKQKYLFAYRILYVIVVFMGPYLTLEVVWNMADTFNGLMAFPNIVALLILSPTVGRVTRDYFHRIRQKGHSVQED